MKISVCLPTYNSLDYIHDCIGSIAKQTYKNYEIIICNDASKDEEELKAFLKIYKDKKINIKFSQNEKNLGYSRNLKQCVSKAIGDLIFLMSQDDIILDKNHFKELVSIFSKHPKIGVLTRPYYWFDTDINTPIRITPKSNQEIIDIKKDIFEKFIPVIETVGQLSGLVYRKKYLNTAFNTNVFTAHIYPFFHIMKNYDCYFLQKYSVAIRTSSSQTRFLSSIYNPSPLLTWVEMFKTVFSGKEFTNIRLKSVDYFSKNYLDIVQIKNYGYFKDLLADIYCFIKFRKRNLFSIKFWFYVIMVLITPRFILRRLVDFYKNKILSRTIKL